jgi:hypothetical protein
MTTYESTKLPLPYCSWRSQSASSVDTCWASRHRRRTFLHFHGHHLLRIDQTIRNEQQLMWANARFHRVLLQSRSVKLLNALLGWFTREITLCWKPDPRLKSKIFDWKWVLESYRPIDAAYRLLKVLKVWRAHTPPVGPDWFFFTSIDIKWSKVVIIFKKKPLKIYLV